MSDSHFLSTLDDSALAIVPEMQLDDVLEITQNLAFMAEQIKLIQAKGNAALMEWIQENGSFEFNSTTYSVGKTKTVKCTDLAGCLDEILACAGGDMDELVKLLSSDAIKQGAAKGLLGDDWKLFFKETWTDKLVLKKTPTNQLPKRNKS